jgi:ELWxxDGT repeat protein
VDLLPNDLTAFNGMVLFSGEQGNLWETNGTAAGTIELTGISGASASGITPSNLTVFENEVLFSGMDTANNLGLWVTNGTSSGTYELTGIVGAASYGVDPNVAHM